MSTANVHVTDPETAIKVSPGQYQILKESKQMIRDIYEIVCNDNIDTTDACTLIREGIDGIIHRLDQTEKT